MLKKTVLFIAVNCAAAASAGADTHYTLDRVLYNGYDSTNVEGEAIVYDSGPSTPIEHLYVDAAACNQDACSISTGEHEGVQFSPAPAPCVCTSEHIDLPTYFYTEDGSQYVFGEENTQDVRALSIIRRGSNEVEVASPDPSLILRNEDGDVYIFTQD